MANSGDGHSARPHSSSTTQSSSGPKPAPSYFSGIGNAGHPGYHALCGIGVGITVNGTIYTGTFGHRLTLGIAGFAIRPGDRVVVWNGSSFVSGVQFVSVGGTLVFMTGILIGSS